MSPMTTTLTLVISLAVHPHSELLRQLSLLCVKSYPHLFFASGFVALECFAFGVRQKGFNRLRDKKRDKDWHCSLAGEGRQGIEDWLMNLDGGRGVMVRYLDAILKEFGDLTEAPRVHGEEVNS
eukprot:609478-Amphidinium_carterae.1